MDGVGNRTFYWMLASNHLVKTKRRPKVIHKSANRSKQKLPNGLVWLKRPSDRRERERRSNKHGDEEDSPWIRFIHHSFQTQCIRRLKMTSSFTKKYSYPRAWARFLNSSISCSATWIPTSTFAPVSPFFPNKEDCIVLGGASKLLQRCLMVKW